MLKLPGDPQSSSTKVAPAGVGGLIGNLDEGVVVLGGLVVGGALEGGGAGMVVTVDGFVVEG
jgi:hypothetical protein